MKIVYFNSNLELLQTDLLLTKLTFSNIIIKIIFNLLNTFRIRFKLMNFDLLDIMSHDT